MYGIPRAKLRSDQNQGDANAQQLAKYLDDNMRIPRARLHDTSSLGSGSSEFTIREEIERRVITDVTKTEMTTTTAEENGETVTTHHQSTSYGNSGGADGAAAQHVSIIFYQPN